MTGKLHRREFVKMLGSATAALAAPSWLWGKNTAEKPNFIIILADDMGYGDSSCFDGWIDAPNLQKLTDEGMKFTDFHSSGVVCSPTRAGLMTGRYQQRAGVPGVIYADPKEPAYHTGLKPNEITFPKLLKKAGYTSAIFGKWHLGYAKKYNPVHHGFDEFRGYVSGNIDYISHYDRMNVYDWWDGLEHVRETGYVTHLIENHSVRFIEANKDRPFCLYVSHEAVHTPLQGPDDPPGRGPKQTIRKKTGDKKPPRSNKETYRIMMNEMDKCIGRITETVQNSGIAEKTLIFFLSDNGATKTGSNQPLRGFKGQMWEGGHRVPTVAWLPGKIKAGSVTDQLAISLDIMPTILDMADASVPPGHKLDGVSLVDVLFENNKLTDRKLFWNGKAMRDGKWKLVIDGKNDMLFDLSSDIGEQKDLSDKYPERVNEMKAEIEKWQADVGP